MTDRQSITHACPRGSSNVTPCCDRLVWELPRSDRLSLHPDLINCEAKPE